MTTISEYSDAFKDSYGFRPCGKAISDFKAMPEDKKQSEIDRLSIPREDFLAREALEQVEFDSRLRSVGLDPRKYQDLI